MPPKRAGWTCTLMCRFIAGDHTWQSWTQDATGSHSQPGRSQLRKPTGFSFPPAGWNAGAAGGGADEPAEPRLAEEPCSVAWAPASAGAPTRSPAAVARAVSPAANRRRRVEWDIRWFLCSFLVPAGHR